MKSNALLIAVLLAALISVSPGFAWEDEKPAGDPQAAKALVKAEERVYSPLSHGLESLTFQQLMGLPNKKKATITTVFHAPDKATFEVEIDKGVPNAEILEQTIRDRDWDGFWMVLGYQLGRVFTLQPDKFVITFDDDSKSRIRLSPVEKKKGGGAVNSVLCVIGEDGLVESCKASFAGGGSVTNTYTYKKYKETDLHLIDRIDTLMETPFGDQKSIRELAYFEVDGYFLIHTVDISFPGRGDDSKSKLVFRKFAVNMKPEEDPEADGEEKPAEKKGEESGG